MSLILFGQFHGDSFSPVQHAVLRVQQRLVTSGGAGAEGKEQRCRLVIASSQVGCLLGKGGSIMSEMRKQSNAFIRILARDKDPIPDGLEQEEEVIQVLLVFLFFSVLSSCYYKQVCTWHLALPASIWHLRT